MDIGRTLFHGNNKLIAAVLFGAASIVSRGASAVSLSYQSTDTPALTVFNGQVVMAYTGTDSNHRLNYAISTLAGKRFLARPNIFRWIEDLNQDRADHRFANLAWLCFDHHDEYDSTTRQSKGSTAREVRTHRDKLLGASWTCW